MTAGNVKIQTLYYININQFLIKGASLQNNYSTIHHIYNSFVCGFFVKILPVCFNMSSA